MVEDTDFAAANQLLWPGLVEPSMPTPESWQFLTRLGESQERGGDLAWWQLRRTMRLLQLPQVDRSMDPPMTRPRCEPNNPWGCSGHTKVGAWPWGSGASHPG
ncbi:uncharacterized protein LOC144165984 [Haemaphysalis longicornis]